MKKYDTKKLVLLALLTGLPSFVLTLMGADLSSAFPVSLHLLNLVIALYVLSLLVCVYRHEMKKSGSPVLNGQGPVPMEQKPSEGTEPAGEIPSFSWSREDEEKCRTVLEGLKGKEVFREKI